MDASRENGWPCSFMYATRSVSNSAAYTPSPKSDDARMKACLAAFGWEGNA